MTFISQQVKKSSKNIGSSDLTISSSGTRKLVLGGGLSSDMFSIRNSSDTQDFFRVKGNGQVEVYSSLYPILRLAGSYGAAVSQIQSNALSGQMDVMPGNSNNCIIWGGGGRAIQSNSFGVSMYDGKHIDVGTGTGTKIGRGSNRKLGFWNATPVVQPTTGITAGAFVANTSGISDDSATYDGYTIGQIAAALRQVGILA